MNKSLKKNYIYNLIYQIFLIIVPIFVTPYLSRILLSDGIGKYSYTSSIVSYFTLLAVFGFTTYGQRAIANYRNDKHRQTICFWEIFCAKIFTCFLAIVIYVCMLLFKSYDDSYITLFWIQLITLGASIFDINFLFYGNEEFGKITIRNLIIKIFSISAIFIFIKSYNDLWIYVLIQSLSTLISNLSIWVYLKKILIKIKFKELNIWKHFLPALLIFLPSIATSVYTTLDKTLIGLLTQNDSAVGNYESGEKLVRLCLTIIISLTTVFVPRNASYYLENKHDDLRKNVHFELKYTWFVGIPMFFGLLSVSKNLIPWYLGLEYGEENLNEVVKIMQTLSATILFTGIGTIFGSTVLVPAQRESKLFIAVSVGAIINFSLNLLFIKLVGAVGACISTLISEAICMIIQIYFSRDFISIKDFFKTSIKPLISGVIMFIPCFILGIKLESNILNTLLIISVGIVIYLALILILKDEFAMYCINNLKCKILTFHNHKINKRKNVECKTRINSNKSDQMQSKEEVVDTQTKDFLEKH